MDDSPGAHISEEDRHRVESSGSLGRALRDESLAEVSAASSAFAAVLASSSYEICKRELSPVLAKVLEEAGALDPGLLDTFADLDAPGIDEVLGSLFAASSQCKHDFEEHVPGFRQ